MMLGERFDNALVYASRLHRGQLRKGTDIPYISHLLAVASLVIEYGGDEDQAIAALLHDAAEDQGGEPTLREIRETFGNDVADIVAACTDAWVEPKPPWHARKAAYLAALPHKQPRALLVSLADKVHNARAIVADRRAIGDAIFDRFTGRRDGTLWYYRSLSDIFTAMLPGPAAQELDRLVGLMAEPAP
ncbi:MAG: HD domain-containing protein [Bauldia sp.]|nr:HD domain-containing protein [Bauldia sp.]